MRKTPAFFLMLVISCCVDVESAAQVPEREQVLIDRIEKLERRLSELEAKLNGTSETQTATPRIATRDDHTGPDVADVFRDTTFNVALDGYYSYNFNRPVGGINLLRAYDVQSNSFSLNQAAIVIENAPNVAQGKRHGFYNAMMDLIFIGITMAFFLIAISYVRACEKLQ